ncbi:MAG TPA: AAA family ATPase [Actinopolymorphaceae bacterium]
MPYDSPLRPQVLLITGIMASGKSTVAQRVAERLDRSVHVRGDVFRRMIVTGNAAITPEGSEEMDAELRLRYRLSAMVADEYAKAGYTVIVQDIILGQYLAAYPKHVSTRPFGAVVLAPRPEVVVRREAERPKTGYAGGWTVENLDDQLRRNTPRLGLWLDNSDQTPDETADEILARLGETIVE